jgi:hypothetical protein
MKAAGRLASGLASVAGRTVDDGNDSSGEEVKVVFRGLRDTVRPRLADDAAERSLAPSDPGATGGQGENP